MLERVDVGDAQTIGDEAPRRRAAPRSNGNPLLAGKANEIPSDEEVARKTHLVDDAELAFESLVVIRAGVPPEFFDSRAVQPPAIGQSFLHDALEIAVDAFPFGHFEARQLETLALEVDVHALRNGERIVIGLFVTLEKRSHLRRRLEIELIAGIAHAVLVGDFLAGADTEQNVVRFGVLTRDVVAIVGRDSSETFLAGELHQARIHRRFIREAQIVVLDLEKEIILAENVAINARRLHRFRHISPKRCLGNFPFQTCRETNEPFRVLGEKLFVDPRLVVEAFEKTRGDELDEVAVALVGLRKQHEVVIGIRNASVRGFVEATPGCDINLASKNGFDAGFCRRVVEIDGAEHVPVIRERDGRHPVARRELDDLADTASPVEQGKITVIVKMHERPHKILSRES